MEMESAQSAKDTGNGRGKSSEEHHNNFTTKTERSKTHDDVQNYEWSDIHGPPALFNP